MHMRIIRQLVIVLSLTAVGLLPYAARAADDADERTDTERAIKPYDLRVPGSTASIGMTPIPGGVFRLGSPDDEGGRGEDEGPAVRVRIEPFWMSTCEITWAAYDAFLTQYQAAKDRKADAKRIGQLDAVSFPTPIYQERLAIVFEMGKEADHPAVCMTQLAAKQFTKWLSRKTGRFYRLATEAEWEYACRATTGGAYHFGDDEKRLDDYAWHAGNSEQRYHKVGQLKPNAWGLHDMHGNVAEWTLDAHDPRYYASLAKKTQPVGWRDAINWPRAEYPRVVRGGHFESDPAACRAAARLPSTVKWKLTDPKLPRSIWWQTDGYFVGFRIIRPLKVPADNEKGRYWDADTKQARDILKDDLQATMTVEPPRDTEPNDDK